MSIASLAFLIHKSPLKPKLPLKFEPEYIVVKGTIKENDVLAKVLQKNGVHNEHVNKICQALNKVFSIEKIQPKKNFEIYFSTDKIFDHFIYRIDPTQAYRVNRSSSNTFNALEMVEQTVWVEKKITVTVKKFLEVDLREAGYDPNLIDNLTYELGDYVFGWQVDFFSEQRVGDKLEVFLEQEYIIGQDKPIPGGKHMRILAASYYGQATRQKENYGIRFQPEGQKRPSYFDREGKALQRVFLRAPFTKGVFRVSSGFNRKRFHPILRTYRAHHGTDYAASAGTPVAAIGKGTIIRASWYKGYGNCIDIRHNARYVSRYGHLSKIAVKVGQAVDQGRYIGNVGSTGLSTGPHLHFEMLVDGSQRNFLAMSFPAASSLTKDQMIAFSPVRDELLAKLKSGLIEDPKQLAQISNEKNL
ncbi:MAG: peptidoglycan DD-metalloendopeptidase family protein [Elusimicrobiota bacterium]